MPTTTRKPGFTLLEVLVAASSLVILSIVIVSVMGNVLLAYGQHAQTQQQVSQSEQAVQRMSDDIRRSTQVAILRSGEGPVDAGLSADEMLVLSVPTQDAQGNSTYDSSGKPTSVDTVIYCVQTTAGTPTNKALYRFWQQGTGALNLSALIASPLCSIGPGGVNFLTGLNNLSKETLTASAVRPVSINFWEVRTVAAVPTTADAVRVQLVTQYDQGNLSSGGKQGRASDAFRAASQLVLRTTVERDAAQANFGFE